MWLCKSIEKKKRRRKLGVKDGQVSQQLKQWVHRCPPLRIKKEKGKIRKKKKNKDSPWLPARSSKF